MSGQPADAARRPGALSPAPRICRAGAGDWHPRPRGPVRRAIHRWHLRGVGRTWRVEPPTPCRRGRGVFASAHTAHGRNVAGSLAVGRDNAGRCVVARILLRRQHRRCGHRQSPLGFLSARRLRHHRCHLRGVSIERDCRGTWLRLGVVDAARDTTDILAKARGTRACRESGLRDDCAFRYDCAGG